MTSIELLHLVDELEACGYDVTTDNWKELAQYADPDQAGRIFLEEANEPHPSLSLGERNR